MISPRAIYENIFIERKHIILRQTAERIQLMIRKVAGEQCDCFVDAYAQGESGCPECFNTRWVGGYELIRDVLLRIENDRDMVNLTDAGYVLQTVKPAWLANFPLLQSDDVIVTPDNFRFRATQNRWLVHQGVLTEQTMSLTPVDSTDIIYDFPVDGPATEVPEPVCA